MKLTIRTSDSGWTGTELADLLRVGGVECEYADPDHVVLMVSGNTTGEELGRVAGALGTAKPRAAEPRPVPALPREEKALSIRVALLGRKEAVAVESALGRVLAAPSVSCPPAVPILVCGERVTPEAVDAFRYYGMERLQVVKE